MLKLHTMLHHVTFVWPALFEPVFSKWSQFTSTSPLEITTLHVIVTPIILRLKTRLYLPIATSMILMKKRRSQWWGGMCPRDGDAHGNSLYTVACRQGGHVGGGCDVEGEGREWGCRGRGTVIWSYLPPPDNPCQEPWRHILHLHSSQVPGMLGIASYRHITCPTYLRLMIDYLPTRVKYIARTYDKNNWLLNT